MKKNISLFSLFFCFCTLSGQSDFNRSSALNRVAHFLSTLTSDQKTMANLDFDDDFRSTWSNLPMEEVDRKGIMMSDLNDIQRLAIHGILRSVLSPQGYQKCLFIIQYDESTHERLTKMNNPIARRYGHSNYWFSVFGNPEKDKSWAWKFEGHHLSLHFTFTPEGVTCGPMFMGINPALTRSGPYAGYHIMNEEFEFGNHLFNDLTEEMKGKAITGILPPDADVMTKNGTEPHVKDRKGLAYTDMTIKQQQLTEKIIRSWVDNLTSELSSVNMDHIMNGKDKIIFSWNGTRDTNDLHYYAVKSDDFIIEFTNRDGGIDHYHTLWFGLPDVK
ncbi:MAG: DUF3500 domain-containing protein [Saprospiraceae bacterium]|nr:DUF3500 domain-containing protein [Saprospiraceae bacterium]